MKQFVEPWYLVETKWDALIKGCDANENGSIDIQEFCTAAQCRIKACNKENLQKSFQMFDKNDDGYID